MAIPLNFLSRTIRGSVLVFVMLIGSCETGFSQATNSFFQFVQDQSERHYSNVPHEVLAFYYGWFGNPRNAAWGKVDTAKHEIDNIARFPVEGAYSSHDSAVIEWQIDQAKAAGITGFVVSWWGLGEWDKWHDESLAMLLKCAERKNFKISIYWERAPGDGQGQIDEAINDLSYVLNKYGKSQAFLKVDGKPAIFAYNRVTLYAMPVSSWPAIIQGIRERARDFVFFGDIGDDQENPGAYLFDGIHSYGVNLPDDLRKHLTVDKLGDLHAFLANYDASVVSAARRRDRICCLTVSPGFDARKAYKWDTQTDRLDGRTYRTYWDEAVKARPDWVIITSWNEWGEGTEIEPSLELGDKYLKITAEYARRFLESPVVSAPEPAPLTRLLPGTTNHLTTALLNRKAGLMVQGQIEAEFWLACCGATIQRLDWGDLVDPKIFNARDVPLFVYIGNEIYVSSVKVTDDVTQSLIRYMHEGGFLACLPHDGPWPFHYDASRKGTPPICITDNLGLGVDNGFDDPPSGTDLKFYINKSALRGLPPAAAYPSDGDTRFRPSSRLRVPSADYYLPLAQLWGDQSKSYGEAAVYIEHRSEPLWPGKSVYVWMRTAEAIGPDEFYLSLYEFISRKLKSVRQPTN
ncbi:MAG TPA: endo-1,3-alpha-glucanase family glycosylhydrolase [Verrucomicrobiae bacterium]|nr:endo-1,3-alpha-glucanase family glycosylhydrolase [Verrucomicrobiae bacterium]